MAEQKPVGGGAPAASAGAGGRGAATPVKLSVVIPVYNEAETIQQLIGLVVNATVPPGVTKEIICVNDCSTDGTKQKLDELPALFPTERF